MLRFPILYALDQVPGFGRVFEYKKNIIFVLSIRYLHLAPFSDMS